MCRFLDRVRVWCALGAALVAFSCAAAAFAQETPAANPLSILDSWVGGRWVLTLERPDGTKTTVTRTYEWAFDRRVLRGRSDGERGGKPHQARETIYFWNPQTKRIEFLDFIDDGGFGNGWLERRDGAIYMEAKIVGNRKHPDWRAWVGEDAGGSRQSIRVESRLPNGEWKSLGTFDYRRER